MLSSPGIFCPEQVEINELIAAFDIDILRSVLPEHWDEHFNRIQYLEQHAQRMLEDETYLPSHRAKVACLLAVAAWGYSAKFRMLGTEQADTYLMQAQALANKDDALTQGFLSYVDSTVRRSENQFEDAFNAAKAAELYFNRMPGFSAAAKAHVLNQQGVALVNQQKADEAIIVLRIALTLEENTPHEHWVAKLICVGEGGHPTLRANKQLARAYLAKGDHDAALSAIQVVLQGLDKERRPIDYAYNLTVKGTILKAQSEFSEALKVLLLADELYRTHCPDPHPNHMKTREVMREVEKALSESVKSMTAQLSNI